MDVFQIGIFKKENRNMASQVKTNIQKHNQKGLKTPWYKRLFSRRNDSVLIPQENRQCFRLNIEETFPMEAMLMTRKGEIITSDIHDLSAGGVSLKFYEPMTDGLDKVKIKIGLPNERPVVLEAKADYINKRNNGTPLSKILGFKFTSGLDVDSEDMIHQFILKKQIDWIRRQDHSS